MQCCLRRQHHECSFSQISYPALHPAYLARARPLLATISSFSRASGLYAQGSWHTRTLRVNMNASLQAQSGLRCTALGGVHGSAGRHRVSGPPPALAHVQQQRSSSSSFLAGDRRSRSLRPVHVALSRMHHAHSAVKHSLCVYAEA